MQILIVGKGACEYALARHIKQNKPDAIVFVAPGNQAVGDFATCIDIQPDNVDEMVEFAQANEVNLTIVCDDNAIDAGMGDAFNEAGLMVFAPEKEAAHFATSKSAGKRFMYRLNIPAPKFGIFDKDASARTYVKNSNYPILLKSDRHDDGERVFLCHSEREANNILNKLFSIESPKINVENYVHGREISFYVLTDGYNALPIGMVVPYKYASEKDGGSITKGVGAYAPAVFADDSTVEQLLNKVVYPVLMETEKNVAPYVGVLGVDVVLKDDNTFSVIEFNTFFKEPDIECVLELLEEDIVELFKACTIGSLSDDYNVLEMKNKSAVSLVMTRTPEHLFDNEQVLVEGLTELEDDINVTLYNVVNKNNEIKAKAGRVLSLCASAATLGKAKDKIRESVDVVKFKGKKYRKDVIEVENDR